MHLACGPSRDTTPHYKIAWDILLQVESLAGPYCTFAWLQQSLFKAGLGLLAWLSSHRMLCLSLQLVGDGDKDRWIRRCEINLPAWGEGPEPLHGLKGGGRSLQCSRVEQSSAATLGAMGIGGGRMKGG